MSVVRWVVIAVVCWILSGPVLIALAILAARLKRAPRQDRQPPASPSVPEANEDNRAAGVADSPRE